MAKLDLLINEPTKDSETQFKQIFLCLQNLLSWSNNILTNIAVSYKEPSNTGDTSTSGLNYSNIPNYSQSFNVKNPVCLVSLNLQLMGHGYIGIFVNGLLESEIPFNNSGFNPITHNFYYNLKVGGNVVDIKWRATTGSVVKANSVTNPAFNSLQIISFNS